MYKEARYLDPLDCDCDESDAAYYLEQMAEMALSDEGQIERRLLPKTIEHWLVIRKTRPGYVRPTR